MLRVGIHYIEPRRVGFFVAEQVALALAFVLAGSTVLRAQGLPPSLPRLVVCALASAIAVSFALSLADLHDLKVALDDAEHGGRLLRVLGLSSLGAAALLMLLQRNTTTSFAEAAGLGSALLALTAARTSLPALGRRLSLHTRVFLVGEGQMAHRLVREIARSGAVDVVGFCGPLTTQLAERARAAGADTVVVATDERRGIPVNELLRCRTMGLAVSGAAVFAAQALHRLPVELLHPSDLIYGDGFVRSRFLRLTRRIISVAGATALLALAAPLLVVAAIAIRRDSEGPIFFRQQRVGRNGCPFEMIKLRTMTANAEADGIVWARKEDPRITRIGKLLRRFRIDELPQLFNVLRGEMDLIGPRPERPEFVELLRRNIPFYDLRHVVPPGITGWAQICYPYAASVEEAREKLQYDLYYVRHLGIAFDLYILLLTARTILLGRGAR